MPAHGPRHLVGTLLPAAVADAGLAQVGRDTVPLRVLPLQFRKLPSLQRTFFVAQAISEAGALGKSRLTQVGQAIALGRLF